MTVPLVRTFQAAFTSQISGNDFSNPVVVVPFAATVTLVQYVPAAAVLASTNVANTARTWTLYNRGGSASASGSAAVILARGALTSLSASQTAFSTGLIDNVASSLPLNSVTASLTVAAGDILEWESSHSGSTGGIDPGGLVYVTLSRI